ncbi:MAG: SCO family protein [Longimicrobiales bacterium]|nr:SCO family protein [Longimicrobiales bacterium]
MRRQDLWPLGALAFLLATTAAWWALALWPLPSDTPAWLLRTRDVCFNATGTGLPDRSGWILLVGEPLGMLAVLVIGWRTQVADSLRRLVSSLAGRAVAIFCTGLVTLGLAAAAVRVAAAGVPGPALSAESSTPETYPRVDRAWPVMDGLVDQSGRPFSRGSLGGRRAMVTFAYAHCTTVCPLLVQGALEAREELRGEMDLAVVALTLDPWRDTPARLPDMAARWSLRDGDVVLGGGVEAVEAALDAWGVPRERDERTGEISHPSLTFLVEGDGTVAFATSGGVAQLVDLARRLR